MALGYRFQDDEEDPFESSFFQQASLGSSGAADLEPPSRSYNVADFSAPPLQPPSADPFRASVFEAGGPAGQPPADVGPGIRSRSSPPLQLREPPSAAAPGGPSQERPDLGSLVGKIRTARDPRERAIAQDSLARTTFSQLKDAGHDVKWQNDQLIVDGRPYVIGDGAQPAGGQPPVNTSRERPMTPGVTDYAPNPNVARPHGASAAASAGAGWTPPGSWEEAYDRISAEVDPNLSREEMEAEIDRYFGHLPGYGGAYKESVMRNGRWMDMINAYGGANAAWGGLNPKIDRPKSSMMSSMLSPMSGLLSPFGEGGSGTVSGRASGARGVDLSVDGLNPTLLALLQAQQPEAEPDPMAPTYMNLLQR